MYRALALLALPLLVAGCGSPSKSARSEQPPPTIDSFRSSYLSGKPVPEPQPQQTQVAAIPVPAPDQAAADQGNTVPQASTSDQSDNAPAEQAAAAPKPAAPPPYKASVAAYIKRYAVDSSSLKLAKIGTPFPGSVNGQKGSVVCVELGAGGNRTAYLLKDNSVADSELGATACQNKKLQPWSDVGST